MNSSPVPSLLAALALHAAAPLLHADATGPLPRGTPEAHGVSSAAVLAFVEAADRVDAMHGFMLVRHGTVIAEGWWTPYEASSPHELYSLSKSFTSTAVGLAVAEGRLSVDDPVAKAFPGDAPAEPSANLAAMRLRDLLCMSTGHQDEPPTAPDRMSPASFLAHPVPHKPGTHFKYNTAATFMQSAMVQRAVGEPVLDYLGPRLFAPLGIRGATWATNFQGVSLGGYGLKLRTEDVAKFGELYLRRGRWGGRQLVPESWIAQATSRQAANGSNPASDWDQGYGYQFWRCRHGAYRGDGAFGQYCIVMPEQDAVVAINGGMRDMQAVLNLVWDKLLPAMKPGRLRADAPAARRLRERLSGLSVRVPEGAAVSPLAPRVAGATYRFPAGPGGVETLSLETSDGGWVLTRRIGEKEFRMPCGHREWRRSRGHSGAGTRGAYADEPMAASGGWISDDTFVAKVCAYETPFHRTLRLRFEGDRVTLESETNVGFGDTRQAPTTGVRE